MSVMSHYAALAANLAHHGLPHLAQRVEDLLESDAPSALTELAELVMLDEMLETREAMCEVQREVPREGAS